MALKDLIDEAFQTEAPAAATTPEASAEPKGSRLRGLIDEEFSGQRKPDEPGFFSKAADAVTSAVTAIPKAIATGFRSVGPAVAPDAAKPAADVALPQAPAPEDLTATSRSAAVGPPKAPAPPPAPVDILKAKPPLAVAGSMGGGARGAQMGQEAGAADRAAEAARQAALVQGPRNEVIAARPEGQGDEERGVIGRAIDTGLEKVGLLDREQVEERRRQQRAAKAVLSIVAGEAGKTPNQFRQPSPRILEQAALGAANSMTLGIGKQVLKTYGFEDDTPETTAEGIAHGAGELGGFMLGPAKLAHQALEGRVLSHLAPARGNAADILVAKSVASQAATLGLASVLQHAGDLADAPTLLDALKEAAGHAKGGAVLGAAFGGLGGTIHNRAARLGVGLATLDLLQGTHPMDEREWAQKAFDYGLNIFFLWQGQDPRRIQAALDAKVAENPKGPTQEAIFKSALDKAMERAAKLKDQPTEPGAPPAAAPDLKAILEEELAAATAPLKTAAEVAAEKTGGPIIPAPAASAAPAPEVLLAGMPRPAAKPAAPPRPIPNVVIPGQAPTVGAGPVRILGPTGRPTEAAPAPVEGLKSAQELAAERGKGIRRPAPPAPQAPTPAVPEVPASAKPAAAAASADRPVAGLAFKDYVEAAGKKWPLTAQDPDFARLRFEFGDLKKGLYEARPSPDGRWAVINRKTGEEVDHLPSGAKAQLEANRLNSVVTLDAWRNAQVPQAPVRMVLPERKPDLSAKPAPEPKVEPGTAAAQQKEAEAATVEGPPPSAEPPAAAKAPAAPAAPAAVGKTHEIRVPAGGKYQIRYEAVEAEDLIPSHDPKTFTKDARYPEGVQNRPYHSDKSEQAKVIRQAQDLEPLFLVRPSPDASGTPILAPDSNVVLSGNSRTMTLLRTLGTEGFQKYRQALNDMAPALGLDPKAIEGMRNPVVVRRLVGTDTTPEFYRRFAKETNETFIQALNTQAAAVSQGKAMQPETMEWIAGAVDSLGENATLRDFLRSGRDREIIRRFIQDGVFTERDLNRYIDPKTTMLNEDGKRLVERAILGNAIPDPDLLNQAPAAIVAKIERSLGALAKIKGRGEAWDLGKDLEDAVRTVVQVQASGAGGVDALRRQGSLLEEAGPTSRADTLADALLRLKPNDFKAAIGRYADEAQRDVRGQETLGFAKPATPADAFRAAFGGGEARKVAEPAPPYGGPGGRSEGGTPKNESISSEAGGDLRTSRISQPPFSQEPVEGRQVSDQTLSSLPTTRQTAPSTEEGGAARYSGVREPAPNPSLRFSSIDSASERRIRQEHNDINALMFWAGRANDEVPKTAKTIDAEVPGAEFRGGRVKKVSRVLEKVKRLGKPAETIGDYYGMTWSVNRAEDANDLVKAFERNGWRVVEDENFMDKPKTPDNWRARFVQVQVEPGFSAEVRIVPKEVAEALPLSHSFLDIYRDEDVTPRLYKSGVEGSRAVNDDAWARYDARVAEKRAEPYPSKAVLRASAEKLRQIAEDPATPDKFQAFAREGLDVIERIYGKQAERQKRLAEPPENYDLPPVNIAEAVDAGGARGAGRMASGLMMRLMGGVRETRPAYRPVVESEPFKRWFGKSKVTDQDGTPKLLYHGTNNPGFDTLDPKKLDPGALVGRGFYMTEAPDVAGGGPGSKGYAAKGAMETLSPEAVTRIIDAITSSADWKSHVEGGESGYLSSHEKMRAKSMMTRARGDANGIYEINELRGQPFNMGKTIDRAMSTEVGQGGVYPLYARIEHPFNYDGYLTREQARKLVDTAKRMIPSETGRVQLESSYESLLGPDKNVPAMEAIKDEMRSIAARNGFGTVAEQKAAEERYHTAWLAWKNKDVNSAGYKQAGDDAKAAEAEMKARVPGWGQAIKGPEAARYAKLSDQLTKLGTWQNVTGAPAERIHEILKAYVVAGTKREDGVNVNDILKAAGFDGITHLGGKVTGGKPHQVWVAFDPEQVKSATGNRGTFDPENPSMVAEQGGGYGGPRVSIKRSGTPGKDLQFSLVINGVEQPERFTVRREVEQAAAAARRGMVREEGSGYGAQAPTFFSALERAITSKMPERASAEQILAITKGPGVKADEVKWTGLDEWLAAQKGPVTKAQVQEFLRQNAAEVKEVKKGEITDEAKARVREIEEEIVPSENSVRNLNSLLRDALERLDVVRVDRDNITLDSRGRVQSEAGKRLENDGKLLTGAGLIDATPRVKKLYQEYLDARTKSDDLRRERYRLENPDEHKGALMDTLGQLQAEYDSLAESYNTMDPAQRERMTELRGHMDEVAGELNRLEEQGGSVRYEKYVLPGGKNYRELLLTLPGRKPKAPGKPAHAVEGEGGYEVFDEAGQPFGVYSARNKGEALQLAAAKGPTSFSREPAFRYRSELGGGLIEPWEATPEIRRSLERAGDRLTRETITAGERAASEPYQSNHWDERNVLASIRFNDRTDKDGKRVLFIEEIQSDWHQAGRKRGYHDEQVRYRNELVRKIQEIERRQSDLYGEKGENVVDAEWERLTAERDELKDELRNLPKSLLGVPDAPFKKTWHELAMKRMLRWAAEHGYERVAWTTGEQQAERYDLSKQVKGIGYKREGTAGEPQYRLFADPLERGQVLELGTHAPEKLADVVGKDLAEKILAGQGEKAGRRGEAGSLWLSGVDLKVGGEGMKGFYDKILPEFVAKYGKKWGATVGEITVPSEKLPPDKPHGVWRPADVQVHSIDVTPAMRRSVLIEGQPLFEPGSVYEGKVKARKGATTADREMAQMALFDLEQAAARPVEGVRALTEQKAKKPAPRGEDAGAGVRTVDRLIDAFKAKGFIDFRGQKLRPGRELEDLAVLAQVARDPRYETFRYFYTKGDEIVGSEAFSSRVPGSTMYLEGMERRTGIRTDAAAEAEINRRRTEHVQGLAAIRRRMERLGADGYYIMHNHPSGRPEASENDKAVTEYLAGAVPGLKGHVIIDSGQYGVIEVSKERRLRPKIGYEETGEWVARTRVENLPGPFVTDPLLGRLGAHPKVEDPAALARIGRTFKVPDNYVTLIHRDAGGNVRAVQEMPVGLFTKTEQASDFIRGQQRAFGASDTFAVLKPTMATLAQSRELVKAGVLRDAIAHGATASESAWNYLASKGEIPVGADLEPMPRNTRTVRVQEQGAPYGDFERLKPETRKKLVDFGREVMKEDKTDFASWAKAMRERLGEKSEGTLPGAWAALMQEQARTQAKPAAKAAAEGGKPPEPPQEIPQSAAPLDPPPGMTEPQLKLGLHKDVVDAAMDLFQAGKIERDPHMLISDQILEAIRDGKLRIEDMADVLDKRGMTFSDFGAQMFRPAITDAAKRLGALGQLQRRLNELESALKREADTPGPNGKPGTPGGPDPAKIKTIGDILDAARILDPKGDRVRNRTMAAALAYWRRADNVRRGLLVTQLATSVRNFTSQVGRLGLDVMDQGIQGGLQRIFGKEVTQHPADAMKAMMDVFRVSPAEAKRRVDALLEGLPREEERLFSNYASDLNRVAKKQGADQAIDAGLRGAEKAVEVLNTFNRFQEYAVRRAVFQAELAARLRKRGIDLEEAIKDQTVRREIPVADIRAAIEKALEITFASNPAYGSAGYHFVKWINKTPGATFLIPFPRFMLNAMKFYLEFSPAGFLKFLSEAERQKFRQGDMQTMSRALLGVGLLSTAYLIRSMQDEDTKWNEVRLPGMERTIDVRPLNPFASYLFVADVLRRTVNGNLYGGNLATETVKNVLGVNVRGGTGLQAMDQLVDGLRDIGDTRALTKYLQGAGGHLVAGLLTPLQQLTDVYAEFDPEAQIVRNVREQPFSGPIKQRFPTPLVEALGGEVGEEKASPTSSEPIRRESPGVRQVTGLTFGKAKNDFEKELDRLQIPYREILPSQGDPRLDNMLAAKMGPLAEVEGERLVNSARFQNLGEIGKRLELKAYLERLRKKAKAQAMLDREYREVTREVKAGTSKERLKEMSREEKAGLR